MGVNEDPIKGELSGTNYGDHHDRFLEEGTYNYTLKATDSGKLAFKVEVLRESGKSGWLTVEDKSKIRGGTTLTGSFAASPTGSFFGASNPGTGIEVRFNFNREFLSHKVGYDLTFVKR